MWKQTKEIWILIRSWNEHVTSTGSFPEWSGDLIIQLDRHRRHNHIGAYTLMTPLGVSNWNRTRQSCTTIRVASFLFKEKYDVNSAWNANCAVNVFRVGRLEGVLIKKSPLPLEDGGGSSWGSNNRKKSNPSQVYKKMYTVDIKTLIGLKFLPT